MAKIRLRNGKAVFRVKPGKKGQWRWFLEDKHGKHLAVSAVSGYDTREKAEDAITELVKVLEPPTLSQIIFGN